MSDRVQTAIKVIKVLFQIGGYLWALWGGGQLAVAAMAPETYGGPLNEATGKENTIYGLITAFVAPLIAKGVSWVWAWKRGKGQTPVVDYLAALGMVASLREYLGAVPAAATPLDTLKALVVKHEADRVDPPAVLAVDVK
jgi:hypothetical protein